MIDKATTAFQEPERIPAHIKRRYSNALLSYLQWKNNSNTYKVSLDGYDLYVDLNDKGISRDLILNGVREPVTYQAYRRELLKLRDNVEDTIYVAEVGANVGYYALVPPAIIDDVKVFAAEVSRDNIDLLERNIQLNGFEDFFEVECVGIGNENGAMEVQLSSHSNRHSLKENVATKSKFTDTETVDIKEGTSWLSDNNAIEEDINILRMDTEGYESKILQGFSNLSPDLVHIEVHPKLMDSGEINKLIDELLNFDLDIVTAAKNDERITLESIKNIDEYNWIELVLS